MNFSCYIVNWSGAGNGSLDDGATTRFEEGAAR